MGSHGATIKAIREASGAAIKLEPDVESVGGDGGGAIQGVVANDRLLRIAGYPEAVLAATSECVIKLLQSQVTPPPPLPTSSPRSKCGL